jgi:hypothetical protein
MNCGEASERIFEHCLALGVANHLQSVTLVLAQQRTSQPDLTAVKTAIEFGAARTAHNSHLMIPFELLITPLVIEPPLVIRNCMASRADQDTWNIFRILELGSPPSPVSRTP